MTSPRQRPRRASATRLPARLDPAKLGRLLTAEESLEARARMMTERELEATVASMARYRAWRRYHTHRSDRSPAGFPDDILVRDGRLLFLELKTEAGRVSDEQRAWLEDLALVQAATTATGERPVVEVRVIRPRDLLDGTLERLLA